MQVEAPEVDGYHNETLSNGTVLEGEMSIKHAKKSRSLESLR